VCGKPVDPGIDPTQHDFLVSFQSVARSSLESLENRVFPFASYCSLEYRWQRITKGSLFFMIVCSCNVLSDDDIRNAVNAAEDLPRNPKQIYGCLGCSAECGRCARTIKTIIDEALGACADACCSGCPHARTEADTTRELSLQAAA
jgi:bacterioferritin-associated ferredoxin